MSDNKTRIALWQQAVGTDKRKPIFKGKIEYTDGTKEDVSLWVNQNKAKNAPTFTGVVEKPGEYAGGGDEY